MQKFFAIACALIFSLSLRAAGDSVMFPACFQNNVYHLCEGHPGMLGFYPIKEQPSKKGILRLALPSFVRLTHSSYCGGDRREDPFTRTAVTRDGKAYRRYEIQLSETFIQHWKNFRSASSFPFYLKQMLVLEAAQSSSGKEADLCWTLLTDRGASPEQRLRLKVLPPLRMPAKRPRFFMTGISDLEVPSGTYDDFARKACTFWKGLSDAPELFANLTYGQPVPDDRFASAKWSGSVCYFPNFRPDPLETAIRKGKYNHLYPTCSDTHGNYGLALSYMLDDPKNFFADYLKKGILRYKEAGSKAKYLVWDFEPLATQYSPYDLEVFCRRHLKLDKVLTYSEIEKKYHSKWYKFRYTQSAQLVRKYHQAMKKYWPGIKLMMVSSFLDFRHPENNYRSPYTPLDLRDTEQYIDMHCPMIYWQGLDFFRDVELNKRFLKKPFVPWIDPTEHRDVFYKRYTPTGIRQNILACAALGAQGIIFYPVGNLDGAYLQTITDSFGQIGQAEEILRGQDISARCQVRVANVIQMKMLDTRNQMVEMKTPDYEPNIRWRVHSLGSRYAVSLFNYNSAPVILEVTVPGFADHSLVKVGADDAVILTALPAQADLKKDLENNLAELRKKQQYQILQKGGSTVGWRALDKVARPVLLTGRCTLAFNPDMAAPISWACPYPSWDPMLHARHVPGHLGRIFLMDAGRPAALDFKLEKFFIDQRRPAMLFRHIQKPFSGFQEIVNPYENLEISSQWTLDFDGHTATLICTAVNRNTQGKAMPVSLKIHSYPRIGYKFGPKVAPGILEADGRTIASPSDGNFQLIRKGAKSPMKSPTIREMVWNNPKEPVVLHAKDNIKYHEYLTFIPDPKTAVLYNWYNSGFGLTVEFLTEEKLLKPGESVSYRYVFKYRMDRKLKK